MAIRIVFNTLHRMVYPYLPVLGEGLGVSLNQMSTAISIRSASGAFGPFLAILADLRGRRTGMLLGVGLFTIGSTLVILHPAYWTFILTLVLTTVGYLVFIPSMQAYVGDQVEYKQRGLALSLTELGWSLSFIIGVPLAGLLIARFGWNSPFPALTLLGGLSWLLVARLLPSHVASAAKKANPFSNFSFILASPTALAGLAMAFSFTMANELVNLMFGVWMDNVFLLKITALGAVSIGIGLVEFGGEALVGIVTDRLGKVRAVVLGLIGNFSAALLLSFAGKSLPAAMIGLLIFYFTFEFALVSSLPLMTEVLPSARATLMATNIALISLGRAAGDFLAPRLYQWGKSGLHLPSPGLSANALAAIALNLLAVGFLYFLKNVDRKRTLPHSPATDI